MTVADGVEPEQRTFHIALRSADSREGQAAFLATRTPEFTGK